MIHIPARGSFRWSLIIYLIASLGGAGCMGNHAHAQSAGNPISSAASEATSMSRATAMPVIGKAVTGESESSTPELPDSPNHADDPIDATSESNRVGFDGIVPADAYGSVISTRSPVYVRRDACRD